MSASGLLLNSNCQVIGYPFANSRNGQTLMFSYTLKVNIHTKKSDQKSFNHDKTRLYSPNVSADSI